MYMYICVCMLYNYSWRGYIISYIKLYPNLWWLLSPAAGRTFGAVQLVDRCLLSCHLNNWLFGAGKEQVRHGGIQGHSTLKLGHSEFEGKLVGRKSRNFYFNSKVIASKLIHYRAFVWGKAPREAVVYQICCFTPLCKHVHPLTE
jgi:hypothetical protein